MAYEPRLITPFENSGLNKYFKPFLIGQEAFPFILNAYAWRGSARKREGYRLLASFPGGDKPVMGLETWINPASLADNLIGFSRTKSYFYNNLSGAFVDMTFNPLGAAFSFTSGNQDYFWSTNYAASLWVTNNVAADGIYYWNGTVGSLGVNGGWSQFRPTLDSTPTTLTTSLLILPYKGRLVCLNTTEGGVSYPQRARWCARGTPYTVSDATHVPPTPYGVNANAWRSDIPGNGGFLDADTSQRIVSADIVKDTLIVFFERSTWRLRYTGNEINPFIWERLNTTYGAESTFSNVAFDDAALAFSRYGWIASDTNDVERIDQQIPDDSFSVESTNTSLTGLKNIHGIRDFYRQFVYWTFQSVGSTEANQIYAYNYLTKSWFIYEPSVGIRTFGYYRTLADITWNALNTPGPTPPADSWENFNSSDDTWNASGGINNGFPYIVGGDANGNVYQMFEFKNTPTSDNGTDFNFNITTKRFNPYLGEGQKCRVVYVDLYFTDVPGGEITFQHFIDDNVDSPVLTKNVPLSARGAIPVSAISTGATTTITTTVANNLTTGELVNFSGVLGTIAPIINNTVFSATVLSETSFTIPLNSTGFTYTSGTGSFFSGERPVGQSKYTRVYLNVNANFHQFVMTLSDAQLADPIKGSAQFELQAIVIWTAKGGILKG
jgi:hypothetical protein